LLDAATQILTFSSIQMASVGTHVLRVNAKPKKSAVSVGYPINVGALR
jgi:hypothetical protein